MSLNPPLYGGDWPTLYQTAHSLAPEALGSIGLNLPVPEYCLPKTSDEFVMTWKTIDSMGRLGLYANALQNKRLVCIIRHPAGVIASLLRGQRLNKFGQGYRPAEDFNLISLWLDAGWGDKYGLTVARMQSMDEIERLTWFSVIQMEKVLHDLEGKPDCRIVSYEDLCARPHELVRELFDFCGLDPSPQTEKFITDSTSRTSSRYYSIFKNPLESAWKWKSELSTEAQQAISSVLDQSDVLDRIGQSNNTVNSTC